MIAINHDLKVHAIIDEQHRFGLARIPGEARKLRRRLQACAGAVFQRDDQRAAFNAIACGVRMRANRKRRRQIQHCTGLRDDARAAHGIEALFAFGAIIFGDSVSSIECVVQ